MDELKKALYSPEYLAKEEAFKAKMDQIELKHNNWFKDRIDVISTIKPDRLHNHWITRTANGGISFGFHPDTELPKMIQDECSEAFRKVYA